MNPLQIQYGFFIFLLSTTAFHVMPPLFVYMYENLQEIKDYGYSQITNSYTQFIRRIKYKSEEEEKMEVRYRDQLNIGYVYISHFRFPCVYIQYSLTYDIYQQTTYIYKKTSKNNQANRVNIQHKLLLLNTFFFSRVSVLLFN